MFQRWVKNLFVRNKAYKADKARTVFFQKASKRIAQEVEMRQAKFLLDYRLQE